MTIGSFSYMEWPIVGASICNPSRVKRNDVVMRKVTIDKLEPGMILAKPLLRGTMVILGEGTQLTGTWISRIGDMEIDHLFIERHPEQAIPKEEALAQLDVRFKHVQDLPYMSSLKKIVKEHIEGLYGG